MSKQVYRGVEFESKDQPKNDHHHPDGLRYRGEEYDGDKAESAAEPVEAGHRKVYRGNEEEK